MPRISQPGGGSLTYKHAGVDIDAGDELVERIKPLAAATRIAEVVGGVGGFAGLCSVPADVEDPVLVSGTDGVGTKLKVAFATGVHDTIGFDLVGMCVNDIVTCGARPLFFLDYFATSKLDVAVAEKVVAGIAAACKESGCALLGGETAELPGMYAAGEYDLAGFAVGVVARRKIVDGGARGRGRRGDRAAVERAALERVLARAQGPARGHGSRPRRSAAGARGAERGRGAPRPDAPLRARGPGRARPQGSSVRAMSHITGGGIPGNLPRVLPEGFGLRIERLWARAPIFDLVQRAGGVARGEMRSTFNVGVGFVFVVPASAMERAEGALRAAGEAPFVLGRVVRVPSDRAFEERVEWPA